MIIRLVSWAALLALLSACAASPFTAQSARVNEGDYGRMGGYLQGNLGVAFENFDQSGISIDDSATFNVRGGYRLHPYVATELLFEWLDEFDLGDIRRAVRFIRGLPQPRPQLEVTGGVSVDGIEAFASSGVTRISVGALTHSAPALDLSMKIRAP